LHWKEDYTRFALTCEALKSEKIKYLTRTGLDYAASLSDEQVLNNFVTNIEDHTRKESQKWRTLINKTPGIDSLLEELDRIKS